jgi:hypothetical protein
MGNLIPPRFPYVGALLCAACIGASVWAWMRYSYAWEVTPEEIDIHSPLEEVFDHALIGQYIQLSDAPGGCPVPEFSHVLIDEGRDSGRPACVYAVPGNANPGGMPWAYVVLPVGAGGSARQPFKGRVCVATFMVGTREHTFDTLAADTTASRWHGASIAGLVVGAMGVFVFTAALRHWLGECREYLYDTRRHNQGMDRTSDD